VLYGKLSINRSFSIAMLNYSEGKKSWLTVSDPTSQLDFPVDRHLSDATGTPSSANPDLG
jgi:hypothetical protein